MNDELADWLVSIGYPFDIQWPLREPPITRDELAEAWFRADPKSSLVEWRQAIEDEIA